MANEMITSEHIIDDLRREFRRADINNTRMLNVNQVAQTLTNMGIAVPQENLNQLFREIDADGNNMVDIDEFI